jgi:uncharacterized protein (TIGR02285 family)
MTHVAWWFMTLFKNIAAFILLCTFKTHAFVIDLASDYDPSQIYEPRDAAMVLLMKVQQKLDGKMVFNHIPASRVREWRELENQPSTCLYNKAKTPERQKQARYSKYPLMAFPANRIIAFGHQSLPLAISIKELVMTHRLHLGVTKGRSYGNEIDKMLLEVNDNIFINEGANSAVRLQKMLIQGKLDAIIEYAPVFRYNHPHESKNDAISIHQIKGIPLATFGYFVCANSHIGKQAIKLFDEAMSDVKLQDDIIEFHRDLFFEPESAFITEALKSQFNVQE